LKTLTEYAKSFIGASYQWGGETPMGGFDCSGLVQEILSSVGVDPKGDQNAQSLYGHFLMHGRKSEAGPGALVFFGQSHRAISHVAFMIDTHRMVEAGGGGPNTIDQFKAIAHRAFVRIRPYIHRSDIIDILMPAYPNWVVMS